MKIYKLTLFEKHPLSSTQIILVEYYKTKSDADAKKVSTLTGLTNLLGPGGYGRYQVEIQEIDVKE